MPRKIHYAKITLETRQKLVSLVEKQNMSILGAGKSLSIKPPTAKLIMKKYRQTGTFSTRNAKEADTQAFDSSEKHERHTDSKEESMVPEDEPRLPIIPTVSVNYKKESEDLNWSNCRVVLYPVDSSGVYLPVVVPAIF